MTQLNLNLNLEEIEAAILGSDMDNIIKSSVILMLNQYMENERDAYLQALRFSRTLIYIASTYKKANLLFKFY